MSCDIRERLRRANILVNTIASCGRQFFRRKDEVSRFALDANDRVYFVDKYSQFSLSTFSESAATKRQWQRHFTEGGTLHALVISIARNYITNGALIEPWRLSQDGAWAYGEDMQKVRDAAWTLGIWKATDTSAEDAAAPTQQVSA